MSIEDLVSDVERNAADIDSVVFASLDDVKAYLKQTMFPLMSNVVEELAGIDDELADFLEGAATDILTPETAGVFAAVAMHCLQLCTAIVKLKPNNQKLAAQIESIRNVCRHAQKVIMEITVQPPDEQDEPGDPQDAPDAPVIPAAANDEEVLDGNA